MPNSSIKANYLKNDRKTRESFSFSRFREAFCEKRFFDISHVLLVLQKGAKTLSIVNPLVTVSPLIPFYVLQVLWVMCGWLSVCLCL